MERITSYYGLVLVSSMTYSSPSITIHRMSSGFPCGSVVKYPPAMQETQELQVWSLDQEDPLGEETATHSSILAWEIPRTEEPGALVCGVTKSQTWLSMWAHTHRMSSSKGNSRRLPWSSGKDPMPPVQGAQVRFLVRELRSPKLCDAALKKKKKEKGKRGRVATQDSITIKWKINCTWKDSSLSPWLHEGHP